MASRPKEQHHAARKGVGCRYEDPSEEGLGCMYAELKFGGCRSCIAPAECWLDIKVKVQFQDEKHCPNCSKPNKPFPIVTTGPSSGTCQKCGYTVTWMHTRP